MHSQLQDLVALGHSIEEALRNCDFEAALRLEEGLQRRLAEVARGQIGRDGTQSSVVELQQSMSRSLAAAEHARTGVLLELLQLAQRRRVAENYAAIAPVR